MNEKEILQKIKLFVFDLLKNESTGHDYFHIRRVVDNSLMIAKQEDSNIFYVKILAWLHDVGDYKINSGINKNKEILFPFLSSLKFSTPKINEILEDIELISYRGGFNEKTDKIEVKIVQDADRLDAIGAIGIARAFAYGGKKGNPIYTPNFIAEEILTVEMYKNNKAPTIQHFYDKLLKLKDLMNTETGKKLAEERHKYMLNFLDQFYKEWNA